jgi:DNA-directed RNA polymerase specialized sigma24 family protein
VDEGVSQTSPTTIVIPSRSASGTVAATSEMDFQAPASRRALDALRIAQCEKLLLTFALWLTGIEADAEDLLRETIYCMCDPIGGMPWDPARSSVTTHARFVMKKLARKRWRSSRRKREVLTDRDVIDDTYENEAALPDDAIAEREQLAEDRRRGELLRQRLNPLTRRVFERRCEGIENAAELARLCSCKVSDIYLANKWIVYHANRILAEERPAEEERELKAVRPGAKGKPAPWYKPGYGEKP